MKKIFHSFMKFFKFLQRIMQNKTLPEVDFSVSTQGLTIYSDRFHEPRFLEFDYKGKCNKCGSNSIDIEYYINGNGLEIHSSRFKHYRFIFFDLPYPLPQKCAFRVRCKGQSYTIPFENVVKEEIISDKMIFGIEEKGEVKPEIFAPNVSNTIIEVPQSSDFVSKVGYDNGDEIDMLKPIVKPEPEIPI